MKPTESQLDREDGVAGKKRRALCSRLTGAPNRRVAQTTREPLGRHFRRSEMDTQNHLQARKYRALMARVARAASKNEDYILKGGKEISLYVHRTEAALRDVFRTADLPIERTKSGLRMSVGTYEWFTAVRRRCAVLGEDFKAALRRELRMPRPPSVVPQGPPIPPPL